MEDFVLKAFVINFMDEDKLEVLFFVIAMNAFLKKKLQKRTLDHEHLFKDSYEDSTKGLTNLCFHLKAYR